jgi:hypothetical protein
MIRTHQRIDELDDKQAIHIANKLVEAVFITSPSVSAFDDQQQLVFVTQKTGIVPVGEDMALPHEEAGSLAKNTMRILAQTPDGAAIVDRALDSWFDTKADFGLLTVPIAIALVWFLGASDIEFSIGSFHFKKAGLSGAQQTEVAKAVLPPVVNAATGTSSS